ncbi:MAG: hypothetical protein ACLRLW_01795 [Terrisporobacter sp.]|uniref:hypothetical protein n=1 Tax=Terrisporobacter sp. TaxID=1965305 RepID=UPI0025FD93D0|nr:hypothetical protein [uncultured Terrisporobacter sp.]
MEFEYRPSLLYRFKEIDKLFQGGNRNIQIHYNSIIVVENSSKKTILLLDNVICMAIAKTVRT